MTEAGPLSMLTRWLLAYTRWVEARSARPLIVRLRKEFGPTPNQRAQAEAFGKEWIIPALRRKRDIVLDAAETALMTQAFFHALLDYAITEDERWATRIQLLNASKGQTAVFNLAMRYMIETSATRARTRPKLPAELARS